MLLARPLLITLAGLSISLLAQIADNKWEAADLAVKRLPPAAFTQLPKNVIAALQARGCTIPQTVADSQLHNVIRGEFAKSGQQDWAVLCSVNRVSSILIFWAGSAQGISELAKQADSVFLQGTNGEGDIGYSRAISPVGKDFIEEHYGAHGGPHPPPIDHQGIDDAFIEKGSVVHYFFEAKWLELTGSD